MVGYYYHNGNFTLHLLFGIRKHLSALEPKTLLGLTHKMLRYFGLCLLLWHKDNEQWKRMYVIQYPCLLWRRWRRRRQTRRRSFCWSEVSTCWSCTSTSSSSTRICTASAAPTGECRSHGGWRRWEKRQKRTGKPQDSSCWSSRGRWHSKIYFDMTMTVVVDYINCIYYWWTCFTYLNKHVRFLFEIVVKLCPNIMIR